MPEACAYLSEVGLCAKDYIDREVDASLSGRRAQAHRDRHDHGPGHQAVASLTSRRPASTCGPSHNLIKVFEHLHEKINGSILIISHQERILNIADRIIVLADGQVNAGRQAGADPAASCWPARPCAARWRDKVH